MKRRDFFKFLSGVAAFFVAPGARAEPKEVYAHVGDIVTCEGGHPICAFGTTAMRGGPFDTSHLVAWTQPEPKVGTVSQPCTICGRDWFRGSHLHFAEGEWRLPSR